MVRTRFALILYFRMVAHKAACHTLSRRAVVSYWRKYVHEVLVNRLGGLSLPRKSVVRLTDRPDMTLDVYCGRKTTNQQQHTLSKAFLKSMKTWYRFYFLACLYESTESYCCHFDVGIGVAAHFKVYMLKNFKLSYLSNH